MKGVAAATGNHLGGISSAGSLASRNGVPELPHVRQYVEGDCTAGLLGSGGKA
jgi:hypothetical protein